MYTESLPFEAAIFDLDGVLVNTTDHHFQAWRELFESLEGVHRFTQDDYLRWVDGKPRLDGIRSFLKSRGIELSESEVDRLADIKQGRYVDLIHQVPIRICQGVNELISELTEAGVKLAVASSSKNCPAVLESTGLKSNLEVVVACDEVYTPTHRYQLPLRGKPFPDIFLQAAREMNVPPEQSVGFEDAIAGIEAFRAGKFFSIGVVHGGIKEEMLRSGANLVVDELSELNLDQLIKEFNSHLNLR